MIRTGTPTTPHHLLEGIKGGAEYGGPYREANEKQGPLKKRLQGSRNRKAPVTLATTPFDHRGGQ